MYITKLADKIILLENGELVEEGSFEDLIKLKKNSIPCIKYNQIVIQCLLSKKEKAGY